VWSIVAVAFGALPLISTLALSLPSKAADADQLNENLTPVSTQELIDGASQSVVVVGAMGMRRLTRCSLMLALVWV